MKRSKVKQLLNELATEQRKPGQFTVSKYLRENYPDLFIKIRETSPILEKKQVNPRLVYDYLVPNARKICLNCRGPVLKFSTFDVGYVRYCSNKCAQSDPTIIEKARATRLERYGGHHLSVPEIAAKQRATNRKRYGTDYSWQSEGVKQKIRQSNLERRGVEYPSQCKEVRAKVVHTLNKHYKVDVPAKSKVIRKRMEQTNLQRLGVPNASQAPEVKEAKRQTNLRRSGGLYDTPFSNPEDMRKAEATRLERYGYKHISQSPEFQKIIRAQYKKTCLALYGVEHPMQDGEVQARIFRALHWVYEFKYKGKVFAIQGYEDMAIRLIHRKYGIPVEDIDVCKEMFKYRDPTTGKKRTYNPDLQIKVRGKVVYVEVKSSYTAGLDASHGKSLSVETVAKSKSLVKLGKNYLLMVVRTKKLYHNAGRCKRHGFVTHCMAANKSNRTKLLKGKDCRTFLAQSFFIR